MSAMPLKKPTPTGNHWLPYTQMATAPVPLTAVATPGVRIRLADGRELIDGISSWWTACHGYNLRISARRSNASLPSCRM